MAIIAKKAKLLDSLILLTLFVIFVQSTFFVLMHSIKMDDVQMILLHVPAYSALKIFIAPLLQFFGAQLLVYVFFIAATWYLAQSVGNYFQWNEQKIYYAGLLFFFNHTLLIIAANCYLFPTLPIAVYFWQIAAPFQTLIFLILIFAIALFIFSWLIAACDLMSDLLNQKRFLRHGIVLALILMTAIIALLDVLAAKPISYSAATTQRPNIILIGLDALRPDYTGFYGNKTAHTPTIDAFLKSSVTFSDAHTPLARTLPSWISILTAQYPLHNQARGNFVDMDKIQRTQTLAKSLQAAGYETLFATDDRGVITITPDFGFDRIAGPPGGIDTYFLGYYNDLPLLSNLLIPTPLGRLLFPFNYGNHMSIKTYQSAHFLQLIKHSLHQRTQKPLFFAIHFNLSGWPAYYEKNNGTIFPEIYQQDVTAADQQLNQFFQILKENNLLEHAIVVLLSDHGIGLGLPGDKLTNETKYQGVLKNIGLERIRYSNIGDRNKDSMNKNDYHTDTSYGYGGTVLSAQQYRTLLAFRGFGYPLGAPHRVAGNSSLIDIAPTLLDLLHLPMMQQDGISLRTFLFDAHLAMPAQRALFIENAFSMPEMEVEHISAEAVLAKTSSLFSLNQNNGEVFIPAYIQKKMNAEKQRAIIRGDWMLVDMPSEKKFKIQRQLVGNNYQISFVPYTIPAHLILINLANGKWTADLHTAFAQTAPLAELFNQIHIFYGNELSSVLTKPTSLSS